MRTEPPRRLGLCYLRDRLLPLLMWLLVVGIYLLVLYLSALPWQAVGYATLLVGVLLAAFGLVDFLRYRSRHRQLQKLKLALGQTLPLLPEPRELIEADYQQLLQTLEAERSAHRYQSDRRHQELEEYYTLWAHQIKTPIAALDLLLQSQPGEQSAELSDQLFKIDQYVGMALQFIRTESLSSDLLIRRLPLEALVKQAVRKYTKSFLYKQIQLDLAELPGRVISDEKWLVFVIEQLLSNALKYTDQGGQIRIYQRAGEPTTLVIEDNGRGIRAEDLPRVFEKGYTGYNGRAEQSSTGIGLYLCRQICAKLGHQLLLESEPGTGTRAVLRFPERESVYE